MHRALKNFELYDGANSKTSWIMLDQPKRADGHRIRMKHIEALSNHRWWVQESLPRRQSASWLFEVGWSYQSYQMKSVWQISCGRGRLALLDRQGFKQGSRSLVVFHALHAHGLHIDRLIRLYCLAYASCKVVVISLQSRSPSPVSHRCPGEWFCWTCLDMGHGCWHFTAFPIFFPFSQKFLQCNSGKQVANKWQTRSRNVLNQSWISRMAELRDWSILKSRCQGFQIFNDNDNSSAGASILCAFPTHWKNSLA